MSKKTKTDTELTDSAGSFSVEGLASHWNVSARLIRKKLRNREIGFILIGRRISIPKRFVLEFESKNLVLPFDKGSLT